jgi:putative ABC transport system substrate-binding protein
MRWWSLRFFPALCLLLATFAVKAEGAAVAVLYPEVRAPYDRIFNDILQGIEQQANGKVVTYALKGEEGLTHVKGWLEQNDPAAIISLGSHGKALADNLALGPKVVVGASMLSDLNISQGVLGISLTPAPEKLFSRLKQLAPKVKKVHVVYQPETNTWLINRAMRAAKDYQLEVQAFPAADVREAAALYKKILKETADGAQAVWLLQGDPTLDERSLLPTILRNAWNKSFVVFSSNPSHVKRGALFSLYPDNVKMGASLAKKAQNILKGIDQDVDPLDDLLIAVNVRTAEHLSLRISRAQEREFNLVFPLK